MTEKQKLILFLISCDPGIKKIYTLVKIFDGADFPADMSKNLMRLLDCNFVSASENFDNGTPSAYEITKQGEEYLQNNFDDEAAIEYIKTMAEPKLILKIAQHYIDRKNDSQ